MNSNKGITLTTALNFLLAYCLIRFGLVFSTQTSLFGLTYVVMAGLLLVFLLLLVSKEYAGRLVQVNLLWIICNIACIFILRILISRASYLTYTSNYFNQLIVLATLWGFYLYMERLPREKRNWLTSIYLAVVAVSAMYTLYVAINGHSRIIRNTAFGEYDPQFSLTYGGYDFIYGLVVIYVGMLVVFVNGKGRISQAKRIVMLCLMILFALTIIASSFSTAFALILLATIFLVPKTLKTKLSLIGLLAFCVYVIPGPLTRFIESIPYMPKLTSDRLNELILSFSGRESSAYLTEEGQRLDRIMWSIDAFKAHPFLGVFASGGRQPIGQHTEWIDQLARYGLITATFNAMFWGSTYRKMKNDYSPKSVTYKCIQNAFVVYFILGMLNTISMVVTSAPLFILCPFLESLFTREDTPNRLAQPQ